MRSLFVVALLWLAGIACHAPQPVAAIADAGAVESTPWVTVTGSARVLPEAARVLGLYKKPVPALNGLRLRLEEPLRVSLSDPEAILFEGDLPSGGTFVIDQVDSQLVSAALATYLFTPSPSAFLPCSTIIYDTGRARTPLENDLPTVEAFALPRAYVSLLSSSVTGSSTILEANGFLIGEVLDAHGKPVANARLNALSWDGTPSDRTQQIFYPGPNDVSQGATRATGLFVYLHDGGDPDLFQLGLEGHDDYLPAAALARAGTGQWLTLSPQTPLP